MNRPLATSANGWQPALKFDVEGVESSARFRNECRRQARFIGVEGLILYEKKMEDFVAEKSYGLIFIALGSFQLISKHKDAEDTLLSIYHGLASGGRALISFSYSWMDRSLFESNDWQIVSDHKEISKGLRSESLSILGAL